MFCETPTENDRNYGFNRRQREHRTEVYSFLSSSCTTLCSLLIKTQNFIWADLGHFAIFPVIGILLRSAVFKLKTKNKRNWKKFFCPRLPYDFFRVAVVDSIYVFIKSRIRLRLDLLNFLQPSTGHKQPARLGIIGKNLRELSNNVLQNLRWCISQQRF